jgi:hypothetical protein
MTKLTNANFVSRTAIVLVHLDALGRISYPLKIKKLSIDCDIRDLVIFEKSHLRAFLDNLMMSISISKKKKKKKKKTIRKK